MKIMLIGPSAAGKTTLIQRLIDEEIKYDKTQAVEYIGNFIDTPGEYMQQRGYWGSLLSGWYRIPAVRIAGFLAGLQVSLKNRLSVLSQRLTKTIQIRSRLVPIWSLPDVRLFLR